MSGYNWVVLYITNTASVFGGNSLHKRVSLFDKKLMVKFPVWSFENMEYIFIAITPRSNVTQNGSSC